MFRRVLFRSEEHELVHSLEEHLKERDEGLKAFITTFGLVLNDDGMWSNGEFITEYNALVNKHNDLISRFNKLVRAFNANIAIVDPVGRPVAASGAQQADILKHHKGGKSSRWIAEEMSLSRRTVTTVIGKHDGSDRTTNSHRHVPPHRRLSPRRNPHSCGTAAVPNPRFRALALFGRRPSQCVERPSFRRPKTCTQAASRAAKKVERSWPPGGLQPFPTHPRPR